MWRTHSMRKIFLVDCNNFYVSCERVFNPAIRNKPVVVLGSNDACIVARSNEVKALGVPMGAPLWEYKDLLSAHNTHIYSANFALYGDMSARVMKTVAEFATDIEVYSVDEAFLYVADYQIKSHDYYTMYGMYIRQHVLKHTGIPTSIGIATTKTLAKIANRIAKKNPLHHGVFDITEHDTDAILASVDVADVWGIGYRYAKKLKSAGIKNAYDLKCADDRWIRKNLTINGLKTVFELRGIPCLTLEQSHEQRDSITVSRLFGNKTTNLSEMQQALAAYTTRAAEKVRAQGSLVGYITVFVVGAPYHDSHTTFNATSMSLPVATAYTPTLIAHAQRCLRQLFARGIVYKKVGIILSDLVSAQGVQLSTYTPTDNLVEQTKLMAVIDRANAKLGRNKIFFAAAGVKQSWAMKQNNKSQCFTTNWHELLTIKL